MSRALPERPLLVGAFRLLPSRHELHDGQGGVQKLPRRLVDLLLRLAEQPGAVVSRDTLLDEVWQRRAVADEVLSRAIADLRQAFGDDARAPTYVETIPKTGYRLVADVRWQAEPPPAPAAGLAESAEPAPAAPQPVPPAEAAPARPLAWRSGLLLAGLLLAAAVVALLPWQADTMARLPGPAQLVRSTPLTSDAAWELQPALSADGEWLAYARSSAFDSRSELLLRHLQRPTERVLAAEPGLNDSPAFSPDGLELAYRHCSPERHCELRVRGVDGTPWRALGPVHTDATGLDWSSAGIVASVVPAGGQVAGIVLYESGRGQVRTLTAPSSSEGPDLLPRFVPGSRRVAFARGPVGLQRLHWLDLDRPAEVTALDQPNDLPAGRIQDHRWLDPEHAVVASDAPGFRALAGVAPAGWSLLGGRGAAGLALHPDGGLVWAAAEYDADVWLQSLAGDDAGQRIEVSTRFESHPALSPDGRWLALVSLREGHDQIWLRELGAGAALRKVDSPAGAQAVRPRFSADSRLLFFSVYRTGGATEAWVHELTNGRSQRLAALGADAFAPQPDGSGRWLVYGQHGSDGLRLYRTRPDGSERAPIPGAAAVAAFQVDGSLLWWQVRGARQLDGLDLDSGATLRAEPPAALAGEPPEHWSAAGGALYVVADGGLWWRPALDAEWQRLRGLAALAAGPALALDPAHARLATVRIERIAIDLQRVPGR